MNAEYIIDLLQKNGQTIIEKNRTGNDLGYVIKLASGCIVNCYDSGKYSIQGKNKKEVENLLKNSDNPPVKIINDAGLNYEVYPYIN